MRHPVDSLTSVEELLQWSYFEILASLCSESIHPGGLIATQLLLDRCLLTHSDRVLEIGCGPGATTRALLKAGVDVTVVDASAAMMMANACNCAEAGLAMPLSYVGSCEDLHLMPRRTYDVVLFECVLGFVADRPAGVRNCCDLLADGGRIGVLDMHYVRPPPREVRIALEAIVGQTITALFAEDWCKLFQELELQSWEVFDLPAHAEQSARELVEQSPLKRRCRWMTESDVEQVAAYLDRAAAVFSQNKAAMKGHVGVWRKINSSSANPARP